MRYLSARPGRNKAITSEKASLRANFAFRAMDCRVNKPGNEAREGLQLLELPSLHSFPPLPPLQSAPARFNFRPGNQSRPPERML